MREKSTPPRSVIIVGYERRNGHTHESIALTGSGYESSQCESWFKQWQQDMARPLTKEPEHIVRVWRLTGTFQQDESEVHER